jgi:hypothetical protein
MPFQFPEGQSATRLVVQLATLQWRGAIVGPHGSGKSTLLEALKPALSAAELCVHAVTLRDRQRRLPEPFFEHLSEQPSIAVIDGYEQLGWLDRFRLWRLGRRSRFGLLVTAHSQVRVPTLLRLAPDERLVQTLVANLVAKVSTPVTPADVAASHACHGANVRETFFDLYDRHEELRRAERFCAAPNVAVATALMPRGC